MNDLKLRTWTSFVDVVKNSLGNHRDENFKELIEKLLKSLRDIGADMNIKVHFLHSYFDKFSDNCGDVRDEQGERFHRDIKIMKERYQGRWYYRYSIKRNLNNIEQMKKILKNYHSS